MRRSKVAVPLGAVALLATGLLFAFAPPVAATPASADMAVVVTDRSRSGRGENEADLHDLGDQRWHAGGDRSSGDGPRPSQHDPNLSLKPHEPRQLRLHAGQLRLCVGRRGSRRHRDRETCGERGWERSRMRPR